MLSWQYATPAPKCYNIKANVQGQTLPTEQQTGMWQSFVKIVQASLRTQTLCQRQRQRNYFIWMMPADTSLLILRMISGLRKCC